ncbi:hypothetical protein E5675_19045 [Sphingopyxis sp. PAMC25046]|uniref:hypothetical protein n=1 Tax=Sphingopyxis sp. PAMC25046 TaxID=2565556 RepID=UPI00109D8761|nr:hypothetical protein [Sphingopyxis sp. PAMC25046]QCB56320.1 hypothetical protein E5675_19045 [Sphingopyxis sp. PAMC25046]
MAKFKVTLGEDFRVDGVDIEDVGEVAQLADLSERVRGARHRERLVYAVIAAGLVALAVSSVVGLLDNSFDELGTVWNIVAGPMGLALYPVLQRKGLLPSNGSNS